MQAWEKADAILAIASKDKNPTSSQKVVGMPGAHDLHRYARVARLWPPPHRNPNIPYTATRRIADVRRVT